MATAAAALLLLSLLLNWADASWNAERWMPMAIAESRPELSGWQWLSYRDLFLSAIALTTGTVSVIHLVRPNRNHERLAARVNLAGGLASVAVIIAVAVDPPRPDFGFPLVDGRTIPISVAIDYGVVIGMAISVCIAWCGVVQLLLRKKSSAESVKR